jgi:hypothetical protein
MEGFTTSIWDFTAEDSRAQRLSASWKASQAEDRHLSWFSLIWTFRFGLLSD